MLYIHLRMSAILLVVYQQGQKSYWVECLALNKGIKTFFKKREQF